MNDVLRSFRRDISRGKSSSARRENAIQLELVGVMNQHSLDDIFLVGHCGLRDLDGVEIALEKLLDRWP